MFPASQELGDVLHAVHGYASQVHLNERLLHGRFPAPVALYDGCLERGQAQFRDGDVELSRATDERFQVVLESGFVDLPHTPLSEICEGEYTLPWLLLHFKDVSTPTGRKDLFNELELAIRNVLHKNNPEAIFDLSKGNDKIYELVTSLGSEAEAIQRASALKPKHKTTAKPSSQNPCTHMDSLINELRHPESIPVRI